MQLGVAHKILCKSTFALSPNSFRAKRRHQCHYSLAFVKLEFTFHVWPLFWTVNAVVLLSIAISLASQITGGMLKPPHYTITPRWSFRFFLSSSMLNGIFFRLHFCLSFLYREKHAFHAYIYTQLHSYFWINITGISSWRRYSQITSDQQLPNL